MDVVPRHLHQQDKNDIEVVENYDLQVGHQIIGKINNYVPQQLRGTHALPLGPEATWEEVAL